MGSVDFLSFVLDRLKMPADEGSQLTDVTVAPMLLVGISSSLKANAFETPRIKQNLAWCDALIPWIKPGSYDASGYKDLSFQNLLSHVDGNLSAAKVGTE